MAGWKSVVSGTAAGAASALAIGVILSQLAPLPGPPPQPSADLGAVSAPRPVAEPQTLSEVKADAAAPQGAVDPVQPEGPLADEAMSLASRADASAQSLAPGLAGADPGSLPADAALLPAERSAPLPIKPGPAADLSGTPAALEAPAGADGPATAETRAEPMTAPDATPPQAPNPGERQAETAAPAQMLTAALDLTTDQPAPPVPGRQTDAPHGSVSNPAPYLPAPIPAEAAQAPDPSSTDPVFDPGKDTPTQSAAIDPAEQPQDAVTEATDESPGSSAGPAAEATPPPAASAPEAEPAEVETAAQDEALGASVATEPGQDALAEPSLDLAQAEPDTEPAAQAPAAQAPAAQAPAPESRALPEVRRPSPSKPGFEGNDAAPKPGFADKSASATESRLPQAGTPSASEETDPAADPAAEPAADLPPIQRFAEPFDNPEAKPLFAVLLIDDGELDPAVLADLPFPVTIVLDPTRASVAEVARRWRAAGHEVVILATALPEGATDADLEVTFSSHFNAIPEAVAVMDLPQGGFQEDRALSQQVVGILADRGYGLVTFDRGLDAGAQVAIRAGLPQAQVFRVLDAEGENAPTIRRYLDRAAFKAAQQGKVLVIGRLAPTTLKGLMEWATEGRSGNVVLAPVTALLSVN